MNAKNIFSSRLKEINTKLEEISKILPGEKSHYVRQQLSFQYKCLIGVRDVNEELLNFVNGDKWNLKTQ